MHNVQNAMHSYIGGIHSVAGDGISVAMKTRSKRGSSCTTSIKNRSNFLLTFPSFAVTKLKVVLNAASTLAAATNKSFFNNFDATELLRKHKKSNKLKNNEDINASKTRSSLRKLNPSSSSKNENKCVISE